MSQYYQINISQLQQWADQADDLYPDRMTYHVDNLIEQSAKNIWSVFIQQPDGNILLEVWSNGRLYDITSNLSVWPDQRYCMHINNDSTNKQEMIPLWWTMMLEHASLQWLVWSNKPIQQLNIHWSQEIIS